ncbi:hypothetical protein OEZ86_008711 [Tetradesmus obliquus]|nr:hypothetical protein OEZ86_008711 [Tetradesmus obliquus]
MAEREKERAPVDGAELIEKYITELGPIPERLHRNFRLIRDLDERSAQLQAQVDEKCRQQMEALQGKAGQAKRARHSPEDQTLSREVQAMQQQIINMAEEKMHIAAQVYDLVDVHIRNLDEDLTKFASDLDDEQRESGLTDGETACGRLGIDLGLPAAPQQQQQAAAAAAAAAQQQGEQRQKRKYTRRKGVEGAAAEAAGLSAAAAAADEPVPLAAAAELEGDASEPRYCVCKGVSYGDMVCCDNEECPIEWFHFPCVGLTEQPKGKWYCPDCSRAMQQQQHGHGHHAHGHGHQHKAGR